jgi:hypothetical protein
VGKERGEVKERMEIVDREGKGVWREVVERRMGGSVEMREIKEMKWREEKREKKEKKGRRNLDENTAKE